MRYSVGINIWLELERSYRDVNSTEEVIQVGTEIVDITRGRDKRVDPPIGVWPRPQIPGVSGYADPG